MKDPFYNECSYLFDIQKVVELSKIMIGFNSMSNDYSDKIVAIPTSVFVEGGLSQDSLSPIAQLTPMED